MMRRRGSLVDVYKEQCADPWPATSSCVRRLLFSAVGRPCRGCHLGAEVLGADRFAPLPVFWKVTSMRRRWPSLGRPGIMDGGMEKPSDAAAIAASSSVSDSSVTLEYGSNRDRRDHAEPRGRIDRKGGSPAWIVSPTVRSGAGVTTSRAAMGLHPRALLSAGTRPRASPGKATGADCLVTDGWKTLDLLYGRGCLPDRFGEHRGSAM